jgi:CHAT domain-containing protein
MSLAPLACLVLLVASVDERFGKRWEQSEAYFDHFSGAAEEKKKAVDLLNQILRDAVSKDERLYARWKLACWEFRCGDPGRAREMLEDALREGRKGSFLTFQIHRDLADFYATAQQQGRAEKHLDQALEMAGAARKRDGQPLFFAGQKMAIGDEVATALEIRKAEMTTFKARDLRAAHETFSSLRKKIEAEVERRRKRHEPPSVDWALLAARCDINLVDFEQRLARPFDAVRRLKECLTYLGPHAGYDALEIRFGCHYKLAANYCYLTRFAEARQELAAAAKLLPRIENGRNAGDLENARAVVLIEECGFRFDNDPGDPLLLDKLKEAETHARAALARYGPAENNPIAYATIGLSQVEELRARVLEARGKSREALRPSYQRAVEATAEALRRLRRTLPADDDVILHTRRRLAGLYLKAGRVAEGSREAEEAFELFGKVHRQEDEDLMGRGLFLQQLLETDEQAGNRAQAARHAEAHRRLSAERLVTYLAGLTAPEQIKFFRTWDDPGLHGSLRLGIRWADLSADSAEWLINGKARSAEVLAEVVRQHRREKDYPQFQKAIARQAYLLYGAADDEAAVRAKLLEAEAVKREFAARRPIRPSQTWYTLPKLRERLADDEVYIDVFCLRPQEGAPRAYYAWVVKAKGPVEVVRMGAADEIEPLVQEFQEHMKECGRDGPPGGAAKDETRLREGCLGRLSGLILKDLLPLARDQKRWIVSPDGPLWNVPWGALVPPGGNRYLVEKYTLRYVISGRDLARPAAPAVETGDPWIMANPDLNWSPRGVNGRRSKFQAPNLPGAEQEGQEVARRLKPFFKADPRVLIGQAATKDTFLELARLPRPPRVVYLTTHGFSSLTPGFSRLPEDDVPQVDPLVGCGVAFAGFNFIPDGKGPGGEALPGLLTGAEVLAVDLHGTDLAVLSACQTGTGKRGKMSFGQSPADLRHAFHLAGARAVVSSLWSVDDEATRDLMVSFMDSYARRPAADMAEALARAQREMIDARRRDQDHDTHPYFWAAFTLSGP